MKDVCVDVLGCRALGDTLSVTPTLRKLYKSYGKKISIATHHPGIFENNPYVVHIFNEMTEEIKTTFDLQTSISERTRPKTP